MTDHDDRLDALIAGLAADYNEPGETPRDEIWARMQAARTRPVVSASRRNARTAWMIGLVAASLVLATGIAIGRRSVTAPAQGGPATGTAGIARATPPTRADSSVAVVASSAVSSEPAERAVVAMRDPSGRAGRRVSPSPSIDEGSTPSDYQPVVLQHLVGAEAMITSFQTQARTGQVDARIAGWSRELLATTRLLAGSTVAEDPVMRRLLSDLDLVLAQISMYAGRAQADTADLETVQRAIARRGVMSTLRTTIPARARPAGT
jgi:hypothetical protein